MKKLFSILSIATISFAAITSCAKGEQAPVEEEGINITIIGGDKDLNNDPSKTKTYVSEDGTTVHVYWQDTDRLRVYEVIDGGGQVYFATTTKTTVTSGGQKAEFEANISASVTGDHNSYLYTAIYPSDCASKNGENYRVLIPATQNLKGTNLASDADVLIGAPIDKGNTRIKAGDVLEYQFKRYGTTVKMTLKGITAHEKLRKVEIKAPVSMAGYGYVDLTTGEITKPEGTSTTMTLNVNDVVVDETGEIPVWFRVLSNTWKATESNPIQITVTTDKATYSKEIKSAELVFADGGLTIFGISNLGASREEIQALPNGDYVFTATTDKGNFVMLAYEDGNNIKPEAYSLNDDNKIVVANDNAEKCVYTFTCVSDGDYKGCYTIMDYNGKYLYAAGSGDNNYLKAADLVNNNPQFFWMYTGDGGLQAKSENRNNLRYNTQGMFSCYSSNSQTPISIVSADNVVVNKVPKIIVSATSLTLDAAGNNKGDDITVTGINLTDEITTTVDNTCDWLIADVEDGVLGFVAESNNGDEERNTNITLSSEGATPVVISVTQKSNRTAIEINTTNSGVTGSYADKTFDVDDITFGFTQWMKNNNIQAKSSTTNSLYNVDAIPAPITKITFVQTGTARAIKVYGGTATKPTTEITAPTTAATMVFDFTGKEYTYFSVTTPGNAVYFDKITIEYAESAKLTSIAVTGTPDKKSYIAGDEFDPIGLVVTGTYSDGSQKKITEGITWSTPDALTAGQTTVSITATVNGVTSAAYEVTGLTVIYITKINATGTPSEFWKGDTFNHNGITVKATWSNETETDVTSSCTFTGYDMSNPGQQTVTVTYQEKTCTYDIEVKTIANTQETAYTVAQAKVLIDAGKDLASEVYVKGKVSKVDSYNSDYKSITYWISEDGTTTNQFEVYGGLAKEGEEFTSSNDVKVGADVVVKGKIKKYGSTYELDKDNHLVSYTAPATTKDNASITFTGNATSLQTGETNEVTVTYNGDGVLSAESSNTGVATVSLSGTTLTVTPVGAGSTTITVSAPETDAYTSATKSYTLTVTAPVQPATLPFEFDGGKNDIISTCGMSQSGLGTDYSTTITKLKFDSAGDYVVINFNEAATKVTYTIKGNSFSGGSFDVMESADGESYTNVGSHTYLEGSDVEFNKDLLSTSRYVKFVYTSKSSGNVGLGKIKIVKESETTAASREWDLTTSSDDWTATGNETYFSQPYGYKKANGTLTNSSIDDFKASNITKIECGFKGLRNGTTASKITISLVDKDGNILASSSELELTNQSAASKTEYVTATFTSVPSGVAGFMMKVTTFGKNVLINGAKYTVHHSTDSN